MFGPLAEFAATLGAHVQDSRRAAQPRYEKPLEGKKKITAPYRIWDIHVTSILKLDRAVRMDEADLHEGQVEDSEVAQ